MDITLGELITACGGKILSGGGNLPARVKGISTDTRTLSAGDIFAALKGPRYDGHDFLEEAFALGAGGAIISDIRGGVPAGRTAISVRDTLKAMGDISGYYRRKFEIPFFAITGSNGKTTTKDMLCCVLSTAFSVLKTPGNFNNAVGLPLTLFRLMKEHEACVLELGMNSEGEIRALAEIARPEVAVITNVGAAHLGKLGSMDAIARAKAELLEKSGSAVLNADDAYFEFFAGKFPGEVRTFGIEKKADFRAEAVSAERDGSRFLLNGKTEVFVPAGGRHNIMNALSALAAASYMGVGPEQASRGLADFKVPPMRLQRVVFGGITVLDDTYNANPQSVRASLEVLSAAGGRRIAVLGDMLELGEKTRKFHEEAGRMAVESGADMLFAAGEYAPFIALAAGEAGMEKAFHFKTRDELIPVLKEALRAGDTVLVKGSRAAGMEAVVKSLETVGER